MPSLSQKLMAEFLGTAFLLAAVVGSGVMAERLAGSNQALALLCNAMATASMLIVLIALFQPISGAHYNPAVTLVSFIQKETKLSTSVLYVLCQLCGAYFGVVLAHFMFGLPLVQYSLKAREGVSLVGAEFIATFGLILTITMCAASRPKAVAVSVGLYIFAAYFFTASTSFANPAVTFARAFTDTFTGIRPADVAPFICAQIAGAIAACAIARFFSVAKTHTEPSSDYSLPIERKL